jgi:hypothetical protein
VVRRIGLATIPLAALGKLWLAAVASAVAAWGVRALTAGLPSLAAAGLTLGAYCAAYGAATILLRVPEAQSLLARVRGRRR